MSAEIIDFPIKQKDRGFSSIPRQRVFYLGPHHYAAGPGFSWSTEYWVKRVERGKKWEIYCTHPEESGSQRLFFKYCDPEEVREYFESVEFEISDEEWWEMGWRPTEDAELFEWKDFYREANPEKFCKHCGEIFLRGPLDIRECECDKICWLCYEYLPEDPFDTHECE